MASNNEEKAVAVCVIGGWVCPYAIRVFAALKVKGVEYEFLQEPEGRKSELLLKSNPVYKKIPVLLHQDKPIYCPIMAAFLVLKGLANGDKDEAAAQVSTALEHLEEAFVKCSQEKHYFGGDRISFLDLVLGSHLGWFKVVEKISGLKIVDDEAKYPEITAWADRFCTHHAVKDVMPEPGRLVESSANSALKATLSK